MRILLVSDNYPPNRDGVATSVASLAAGLREWGHEVAVIAPRSGPPVPTRGYPTYLAPSFATGQGGFRFGWISPKTFERLIEIFKPDVVHIHTLGSLGMLAARLCRRTGLKTVLTWHTDLLAYRDAYPLLKLCIPIMYAGGLLPDDAGRVAKVIGRASLAALAGDDVAPHHRQMLSAVAALFDRVIVPSPKTASALRDMSPSCAPCVIPSAPVRHGKLAPDSARLLQEMRLSIHSGDSVLAYVGRLSSEKNLDVLLQAMASQVLPAVPAARLNIIGGGQQRKYERMAEALGISHAVAFAGPVPPELVNHLLNPCKVLAHPSLTETQGMVIAEAALEGVPAVVLDTELEGFVVKNDRTGYATGSETHFGDALVRLLECSETRDRLGSNAKRQATEYTPAQYASRVADVYDELLFPHDAPSAPHP
ncbi:glycosyltransferase [Actinomadura livida]|uniref:Glycosyltransferase family 4 protein n=1 Tax=Actinomadura livida TaxID=79909 RepID=A0A7W7MVC1_9ACTN|nr:MULTISPECIES: glycosyltransferase [Actinomadura]MBB4771725.1 glycosyltransferase involved in cell wall biosynthesis [Actinomadura catellatispora]GGU02127.1 mannosyltransferase [Actinomadura livida]